MIKPLQWVHIGLATYRAVSSGGAFWVVKYLPECATFYTYRSTFLANEGSQYDQFIYEGVSAMEAEAACEKLHREQVKKLLAEYLDFSALEGMLQQETLTAREILESLR